MMAPRSRRRSAAGSQTTATDPASFSHTPRGQCFDSRRVVSTEIQTPLQTRMRPEPVSCLAQVRLPPPFLAGLSLRSGKRCSPSLSAKRLIYNDSLSIPACSRPPTPLVWRAECAHRLLGNLSSCWEGFFVGPGVGSSSRCRLFFFPTGGGCGCSRLSTRTNNFRKQGQAFFSLNYTNFSPPQNFGLCAEPNKSE